MAKIVKVEIDEDGKVTMDYNGYVGKACVTEHNKILKAMNALGLRVDAEATVSTPKATTQATNKTQVRL